MSFEGLRSTLPSLAAVDPDAPFACLDGEGGVCGECPDCSPEDFIVLAVDPEVQETLDSLARYRGLLAREKVESTRVKLRWQIEGMERWLENARRRAT